MLSLRFEGFQASCIAVKSRVFEFEAQRPCHDLIGDQYMIMKDLTLISQLPGSGKSLRIPLCVYPRWTIASFKAATTLEMNSPLALLYGSSLPEAVLRRI